MGHAMTYEIPHARLADLAAKEALLAEVRRLVVREFGRQERIAVADAIRCKDGQIRGTSPLAWRLLQDAEQDRWLAVADAGLGELT